MQRRAFKPVKILWGNSDWASTATSLLTSASSPICGPSNRLEFTLFTTVPPNGALSVLAAIHRTLRSALLQKHLIIHFATTFALYVFALIAALYLLTLPAAHRDFITTLSSAAILATFGSAIATVGSLWASDRAVRISMNVEVLYVDILKKKPWRRWPFLSRSRTKLWIDGEILNYTLVNPATIIKSGDRSFSISIPTVEQDYFDLALFSNLIPLLKNRESIHGIVAGSSPSATFPELKLEPAEQYMAYECLTDIWYSVFVFRLSRYVIHFGVALTISSAALGGAGALAIS